MTQEKSTSVFKNWIIAGLAAFILILLWDNRTKEYTILEEAQRIERLKGELVLAENDRYEAIKRAYTAKTELQAIKDSLPVKLAEYQKLSKPQKIKYVERLKPVSVDSTLVCFDEKGIDSLNALQITHTNTVQQLLKSGEVIAQQDSVIASDSVVIGVQKEIITNQSVEIAKTRTAVAKEAKKVKFWQKVTAGVAVVSASVIATLVLVK